jgi:hypothetical protein
MDMQNILETAHQMIRRHGVAAQAITLAHIREQARSEEAERWQLVHAAICELGIRELRQAASAD